MLEIIMTEVRPTLDALLLDMLTSAAITGVGYLSNLARKYFNIKLEQKHQESLQRALVRAGKLAVDNAIDGRVDPRVAVRYLRASIPDALKHFNVGDDFLRTMVTTNIHDAISERLGVAVKTANDNIRSRLGVAA